VAITANATTYYISNAGNDSNSGTDPSSPWQTINKLNSASLSPGDNVLFRRGDTFYGGITASNSGRNGNPITYGAYGSGNKPVITGFTSVTSWTNKGGNIWESTNPVSTLSTLQMVVINGVNTPMGRYPNASTSYPFLPNFFTFQSHSGTGSGNSSLTSSNLNGGSNWTGADVVVRTNSWTYDKETITSQSGNTISYNGQSSGLLDGWGFFIQNDIRTLDVQNEWYYNPNTKKISIYSIGMPSNVLVSSVETLFYFNSNIPAVSSASIDNLNFMGANTNAIWIGGNLTFSVTNCNVAYSGFEGLLLYGGGIQNGTISNNAFSNCGSSSIFSIGTTNAFTVTNNRLVGSGMISCYKPNDYSGSALEITTPNSVVQYNTIDSSAYCGIQFSGNNIQIRNNFINHSNMVRDDGGGIYTGYQNQTGKVIDGNVVLNSVGNINGGGPGKELAGYGIFIDDFGSNISITNNTVANCINAGINLHDTKNVTVTNNTVYNNGKPGWSNGQLFVQADAGQFTGYVRANSVTNNILFAKDPDQYSLSYYADPTANNSAISFGTFNYNYYAKPIKPLAPFTTDQGIAKGELSLSQWQSIVGGDANSQQSSNQITDVGLLRFEYNATNQSKTVSLDANYIDVKGNNYNGSITLAPYSSAVLIRNGAATQNQAPTANGGGNQTITLPTNSVSLNGSGTDADGTIASYNWTKISGPSGDAFSSSNSASTTVKGLVQGTYQYVLQVTDNGGASGYDTVQVTVNAAASVNVATPVANAGNNQSISLPTSTASLAGSGSVSGGTISSYNWTQISGPTSANIANPNSASSSVTGLVQGVYVFQLKVTDNNNNSNTANVQVTVSANNTNGLLPAVNPSNPVNGINYSYYEASNYNVVPDFTSVTPVKTGNVNNFDITVANRPNQFAMNFTGYINVPTDGQYTFYLSSDDGSVLYIDGVQVVNNDGVHALIQQSNSIGLQAGFHTISVGYFQRTGDVGLQVSYSGPGISQQLIPSSALYIVSNNNLLPAVNPSNPVNGMNYSYYEASNYNVVPDFTSVTPVKTGNVNNFDITVANRPNQFAMNFTGYINVPTDGQYTFYLSSDDGSVLYIDGVQVVNNDGVHALVQQSNSIGLQAGFHTISVGYFQRTGEVGLQLSYSGPGVSKQLIPSSALYVVSNGLLPALNLSNTVNGIDYKYYEASNIYQVPDFTTINPIKTGNVNNFDISVANRPEQFAINYTGYINVPADGQYTFYTSSDDGSILYIDGVQVVNNDGTHIMVQQSGSIGLQAGLHAISVAYFNQTGYEGLQVSYSGPGLSQQLIPSSALYRVSAQSRKSNLGASTATSNATATDMINKDSVTNAIDNTDLKVAVTAYPNPFTNSIVVSISGGSGSYDLVLVDALGRTIWKRSGTKNAGTYQQSINTSSLERGIYFLKVIQNNNSSVIKLVK
ncbi:MAG: PA14 domain-containing protein, partial [Ginsengibacter sp.]